MDKDQETRGISDTPELQESLENEEIMAGQATNDSSVSNTSNDTAAKQEEPEKLLDLAPVRREKGNALIFIIVAVIIAVVGLGIGIFALIKMNQAPQPKVDDLLDNLSDNSNAVTEKIDELKQKQEQELKEKAEKEKKEQEEKEKAEKEKKEKEEQEAKKKAQEKEALKTSLDAEGVVKQVKAAIVAQNALEESALEIRDGNTTLYRPADYKTHIYLKGKVLTTEQVDTSTVNAKIVLTTSETLEELGFEGIEMIYNPFIWVARVEILYNKNTNVVCTAYDTPMQVISCGKATDYNLNEKSIVNSLAEAYNKVEGKYPIVVAPENYNESNPSFAKTVKDTGYKNYQTINPNLGINALSIFYRESASSEWVYLTSSQAAIDCSIYSTDLKKALANYCEK